MSELEDKLNSLLSDPAGMAQVMQLAQQLSGSMSSSAAPPPPPEAPVSAPPAPSLGSIDPALIARFLPLLQTFAQDQSNTTNLLHALRPFLREEKQAKVERAAQIARIITIGKKFLSEREG